MQLSCQVVRWRLLSKERERNTGANRGHRFIETVVENCLFPGGEIRWAIKQVDEYAIVTTIFIVTSAYCLTPISYVSHGRTLPLTALFVVSAAWLSSLRRHTSVGGTTSAYVTPSNGIWSTIGALCFIWFIEIKFVHSLRIIGWAFKGEKDEKQGKVNDLVRTPSPFFQGLGNESKFWLLCAGLLFVANVARHKASNAANARRTSLSDKWKWSINAVTE